MFRPSLLIGLLVLAPASFAETLTLQPSPIPQWKAVYGRIETRDRVPARARIGGTLVALSVTEGDEVAKGEPIARIVDDKLSFQLDALDAQRRALSAQLGNASAELARGEKLLAQGVTTAQRLDALRTQVETLRGQISAVDAQAEGVRQSQEEGTILAPAAGRVLDVPVPAGAVLMPGEPVALISTGGTFLRLAVPERHATLLREGDSLRIEGPSGPQEGRLAKVYPLIENGRVLADVAVDGISDRFVDARILVRLPMGLTEALLIPATAIRTRAGLDVVQVETADGPVQRAIVPGQHLTTDQGEMVEVLSGLAAGDRVITAPATGVDHD